MSALVGGEMAVFHVPILSILERGNPQDLGMDSMPSDWEEKVQRATLSR